MKKIVSAGIFLLLVGMVFAAPVVIDIMIGADATSQVSPNAPYNFRIMKSDINEDAYYWIGNNSLVKSDDNTRIPDNADWIVLFEGGSNASNYTMWADASESVAQYCGFHVIDQNGAIRLVPVSDGSDRITVCTMCTQNLSIYGYADFTDTENLQQEQQCKFTIRKSPD